MIPAPADSPLPPLFSLEGVVFRRDGAASPVLDGASFALGRERVALVGPNGCGKTTLLHVIMGLARPQAGEVRFLGVPLQTEADFFRLRMAVGFLFQSAEDQLFSPTVLEDVAFGPLNLGLSPAAARDVSLHTLERLGLRGFENRVTHRLSGGEKKLVALATVLAMAPEALILDEPSNELDPETRDRLAHILQELDLPMLVVSHDWDFLDRIADRLCGMVHGRVVSMDRGELHTHAHLHRGGAGFHQHR